MSNIRYLGKAGTFVTLGANNFTMFKLYTSIARLDISYENDSNQMTRYGDF